MENKIVISLLIIILGYIVWIAFDVTKRHKRITKMMNGIITEFGEGWTSIDAIDLRQANHILMKENYELLKALREAVEIIEDEYGTEDEVIGPVLIKYRALIYRLEGFEAMIDRLEED